VALDSGVLKESFAKAKSAGKEVKAAVTFPDGKSRSLDALLVSRQWYRSE
jgi:hypothetical protein